MVLTIKYFGRRQKKYMDINIRTQRYLIEFKVVIDIYSVHTILYNVKNPSVYYFSPHLQA